MHKPCYLYVLYIQLAQNTKQFRRLVIENFITVINFLFNAFTGLGSGFLGLLNISPLRQQATSIQCVKYGNTYTGKSFSWHTGGGGGVKFKKKCFTISIY